MRASGWLVFVALVGSACATEVAAGTPVRLSVEVVQAPSWVSAQVQQPDDDDLVAGGQTGHELFIQQPNGAYVGVGPRKRLDGSRGGRLVVREPLTCDDGASCMPPENYVEVNLQDPVAGTYDLLIPVGRPPVRTRLSRTPSPFATRSHRRTPQRRAARLRV